MGNQYNSQQSIQQSVMQASLQPLCPIHSSPLLSLCCSNNCPLLMPVCPTCKPKHSDHEDKIITAENFPLAIAAVLEHQNARDVEVLRENDVLVCELSKFRRIFSEREKDLLGELMRRFETEKNCILRRVRQEKEKSRSNTIRYFDRLAEKGLINYRILFSSQAGLQSFYSAYGQYCELSDISCHIKPEVLPRCEDGEEDEAQLEERVRRSMANTLTQSIMNFIKLKISKRDAMKISCAANKNASSMIRPRNTGLPPLSPPRKVKVGKTETNIGMNNQP